MKKLLFALGVALWLCAPAHAQVVSAYTVSACGAQSNPAGQPFPLTMNLTGNLCTSGTGGGGGGGPVTMVSGAVASGAYSAGAFAVGSGTDGWFVTFGSKGDTASATPGGTAMSVWRQIDVDINTLNTTARNPLTAQSGTGVDIGGVDEIGGPWSFNETQIGGASYVLGQQLAANSAPVVLTAAQITTLTPPTGGATAANQILDPCSGAKTSVPFSTGTSGALLFAGTSAKNNYICSVAVIASAAANFSIVSGSGSSVCTGGTPYALIGSTTAANGMSFAANGGLTLGNGLGTVASDLAAVAQAYNVCILINGTANLAGVLTMVQK